MTTDNFAGTGMSFKKRTFKSRRNKGLFVFHLAFFVALVSWGVVFGQTPKEEFPFVGMVTGDDVNVRAGGNLNYEPLCQLNKEDLVSVTGRSYQWYKIELPLKSPCFVSKPHIEKEGVLGISKVDRLNIRARPDANSAVIGQLKKGEQVAILEELTQWYQIVPTQDCVGWVHSDFVNFYSTAQEYLPPEAPPKAAREKFQQLSQRYQEELSKTRAEEMELDPILAEFEKFVTEHPDSEYLTPARQMKEGIKLKIAQAQHITAAERLGKETKDVSGPEPAGSELSFAEGRVEDMGRIFNRPATHKLMKEARLVCYLKSEDVDLNKYVNHQVRVWGKATHLKRWPHPVITVEDIKPVK